MRTTLTLDDEVFHKLKELAEQRRTSVKEIVNEVLRRGLAAQEMSQRRRRQFKVKVFSSAFRPGVDPLKLNQIEDELAARQAAEHRGKTGKR